MDNAKPLDKLVNEKEDLKRELKILEEKKKFGLGYIVASGVGITFTGISLSLAKESIQHPSVYGPFLSILLALSAFAAVGANIYYKNRKKYKECKKIIEGCSIPKDKKLPKPKKKLEELTEIELTRKVEKSKMKMMLMGVPIGFGIANTILSPYLLFHETLQYNEQMAVGGCLLGSVALLLTGAYFLHRYNKEHKGCKELINMYRKKKLEEKPGKWEIRNLEEKLKTAKDNAMYVGCLTPLILSVFYLVAAEFYDPYLLLSYVLPIISGIELLNLGVYKLKKHNIKRKIKEKTLIDER